VLFHTSSDKLHDFLWTIDIEQPVASEKEELVLVSDSGDLNIWFSYDEWLIPISTVVAISLAVWHATTFLLDNAL
jgi:hypothetical protein